ncbi:hypothetical protein ACLOJK_005457 [Asimina triloba]
MAMNISARRAIFAFLLLAMATIKGSSDPAEFPTGVCARTPHAADCLSLVLSLCVTPCTLTQLRRETIRAAREGMAGSTNWVLSSLGLRANSDSKRAFGGSALSDCFHLYEDGEYRLRQLQSPHRRDDARTWLSAALTSHRTCWDGLRSSSFPAPQTAHNLTVSLSVALALYALQANETDELQGPEQVADMSGLLMSWNASAMEADYVVAKDGSGNYKTIKEAVAAVARRARNRAERVVIYVKSGVYAENVEIRRGVKNVMLVGDGIDKTVITGNRNVPDGSTTYGSATFGVSGDGFWARDITFENTAGRKKHQAVALRVGSDRSAFYRCSFRAYQGTLFLHSQRQFFRDCDVYGTVDFIFGNSAAVLQNCNLYLRRPIGHEFNMITAQGREDPNENTGISIHSSRVAPSMDFRGAKAPFKGYLGRPWKQYSRTVFMKTDLDGLIHPKGWTEWDGDFALSTLYYGEYMNSGDGATTNKRVKWPGFHTLRDPSEAEKFTVRRFIQGDAWIPATGVPFTPGL